MITEQQKAINQCKFYGKKCDELDESIHQTKLAVVRLRADLIAMETKQKEYEKELYSYHKKLRRMVVEI